jgi:hypothetical protein
MRVIYLLALVTLAVTPFVVSADDIDAGTCAVEAQTCHAYPWMHAGSALCKIHMSCANQRHPAVHAVVS